MVLVVGYLPSMDALGNSVDCFYHLCNPNRCVVSGLDVDDERFYYMDSEEKKSYFNKCIDWYKNRALLEEDFQDFLIWLVEKYGDCQYIDHCEQCGDSIYTTTLELE